MPRSSLGIRCRARAHAPRRWRRNARRGRDRSGGARVGGPGRRSMSSRCRNLRRSPQPRPTPPLWPQYYVPQWNLFLVEHSSPLPQQQTQNAVVNPLDQGEGGVQDMKPLPPDVLAPRWTVRCRAAALRRSRASQFYDGRARGRSRVYRTRIARTRIARITRSAGCSRSRIKKAASGRQRRP